MKTLGNIIWIVFRGLHIALEYFIAGLILLGLRGGLKDLNYQTMSAHPIEVKSGKDYQEGKITYMPVYFVMFFDERSGRAERTEADMSQTDESEYIF